MNAMSTVAWATRAAQNTAVELCFNLTGALGDPENGDNTMGAAARRGLRRL